MGVLAAEPAGFVGAPLPVLAYWSVGLAIAACSSSPPAKPVIDGVRSFQLESTTYAWSGSFAEIDTVGAVWPISCTPGWSAEQFDLMPAFQWIEVVQSGSCVVPVDRAYQRLCLSLDPSLLSPWATTDGVTWTRITDLGGSLWHETLDVDDIELSYTGVLAGSDAYHYEGSCKLVFDAWM